MVLHIHNECLIDSIQIPLYTVVDLGGGGAVAPPYLTSQEMQKNECIVIKTLILANTVIFVHFNA